MVVLQGHLSCLAILKEWLDLGHHGNPFKSNTFDTAEARMNSITPPPTEALTQAVVQGLEAMKAQDIVSLDLRPLTHAIASTFVVASATSRTQVEALARSVEKTTSDILNERPWGLHGLRGGEWVILDYSDVVVHIFHSDARAHYALEELWGDAPIEHHTSN